MTLSIGVVIVVSSAVVTLVATDGSGPDPQLPLHSYGSLPSFSNSSLQQVPSPVNDPQRKRQSPSQQAPSPFGDPLPQNQFPSLQGHSLFGGPSPQGQFSSLQGLSPFSGQPRQGQFPAGSPSHGYPPFPKDLPPGFAEVLPSATVAQLRSIHQDETLSWQQKHERIDAIMSSLPAEILDRLPTPPGFNMLPSDVQAKLKSIHGLNWQERHLKIREIIESSLTPERRRLFPPSPPPPM
uniref:Uncharacterized protein n=1 Tax=Parascaris univalens TaxID=6257 RepID=A0A915CGE6_PARUN